jgi:hypothetical protein
MYLQSKIDYTPLIISVACFSLVLILMIFALIFFLKRRNSNNISKDFKLTSKVFQTKLNVFFEALGGTDNVLKIDLDEEKNCLIVQLEDVDKANKLDKLANYNMYKSEIKEKTIYLYFADSKSFYNSLLGK